jgi:hypothetical protein
MEINERKRSVNQYSNEEMIKKQKGELEALEREEENRRKRERDESHKQRKDEEERIKQEIMDKELVKKKIKEMSASVEPDANNPNAVLIIFRYPDWSTRVERRFLKSEKIQVR